MQGESILEAMYAQFLAHMYAWTRRIGFGDAPRLTTALLLVSTGQTLNVLLMRAVLEHRSVVQMPFTKAGHVALFLAIVSLSMVNAMRPSVRRRMAALDVERVQRQSDFVAVETTARVTAPISAPYGKDKAWFRPKS